MDDLVSRITRELPDTDRDRYDIAYERGRAQARSALLFGGLAVGAVAGAAATLLFDPARGRGRRIELAQRLGGVARRVSRTASGKATDLRNRAYGKATELGLPGTPGQDGGDAGQLEPAVQVTTMDVRSYSGSGSADPRVVETIEAETSVAVAGSAGSDR